MQRLTGKIRTIDEIEVLLKETEKQMDKPETTYLTHEEVFKGAWQLVNEDKEI